MKRPRKSNEQKNKDKLVHRREYLVDHLKTKYDVPNDQIVDLIKLVDLTVDTPAKIAKKIAENHGYVLQRAPTHGSSKRLAVSNVIFIEIFEKKFGSTNNQAAIAKEYGISVKTLSKMWNDAEYCNRYPNKPGNFDELVKMKRSKKYKPQPKKSKTEIAKAEERYQQSRRKTIEIRRQNHACDVETNAEKLRCAKCGVPREKSSYITEFGKTSHNCEKCRSAGSNSKQIWRSERS